MKREITHFALCLSNDGYPVSLEVGKLYRMIKDKEAAAAGLIRVIDESGEDYAFTANRFHLVELPADVEKTLATNSSDRVSMA